jgi:hypothetical protein
MLELWHSRSGNAVRKSKKGVSFERLFHVVPSFKSERIGDQGDVGSKRL